MLEQLLSKEPFYVDLEHESTLQKVGSKSVNGFVIKGSVNNSEFVIKNISKDAGNVDNLSYEYLVGQCVNRINEFYPIFVKTSAHLYEYRDDSYDVLLDGYNRKKPFDVHLGEMVEPVNLESLEKILIAGCRKDRWRYTFFLEFIPVDTTLLGLVKNYTFNESEFVCAKAIKQHILSAKYLNVPLKSNADYKSVFYGKEEDLTIIIPVFYLIYFVFKNLDGVFMHNDLHLNNILISFVPDDDCIEYVFYKEDGRSIKFKSDIIVKIIDYGRSFVNCNETNSLHSSEDVNNILCNCLDQCDEDEECRNKCGEIEEKCGKCGQESGYRFGYGDLYNLQSSDEYNNGVDLRPFNELKLHRVDFSGKYTEIVNPERFKCLTGVKKIPEYTGKPYFIEWNRLCEKFSSQQFSGKFKFPKKEDGDIDIEDVYDILESIVTEQTFQKDNEEMFDEMKVVARVEMWEGRTQPFSFTSL